jgi:hypothetical protein
MRAELLGLLEVAMKAARRGDRSVVVVERLEVALGILKGAPNES